MRHLALDVGDERIGVAISDSDGRLARPLEVIERKPGPAGFLRLAELVAHHTVGCIVVGLPLLPDGTEGHQVRSTQAYVRGLRSHLQIPVVFCDEHGTSARANAILVGDGASRRRKRRSSDAVAAAVILQRYLDDLAGGTAE